MDSEKNAALATGATSCRPKTSHSAPVRHRAARKRRTRHRCDRIPPHSTQVRHGQREERRTRHRCDIVPSENVALGPSATWTARRTSHSAPVRPNTAALPLNVTGRRAFSPHSKRVRHAARRILFDGPV